MRLADPARARAVLIGPSSFDALEDLPAVAGNLRELQRLLTDPAIWGLPAENCVVLGQEELSAPGAADLVMNAICAAIEAQPETLLVYYAGHGMPDARERNGLLLALPGSAVERPFTFLKWQAVRQELNDARSLHRVVILDCCFAARAMREGLMGAAEPKPVLAKATAPGTYLLAAVSETEEALSPPGEQYTAFSGELLAVIAKGHADGPELWDMRALYDRVSTQLAEKGRPLPHEQGRNRGAGICIGRNVAYESWTPPDPELLNLFLAQHRASLDHVYQLVGARKAMVDVYVQQELRRDPVEQDYTYGATQLFRDADSTGAESVAARRTRPFHEVVDTGAHFVLLGGPGLGKSTQTVQLSAEVAREWLTAIQVRGKNGTPKHIALRVPAPTLAASRSPMDQALIQGAILALGQAADRPLPANLLDLIPKGCTWLIIVDGMDEITDPGARQRLLSQLGQRMREPDAPLRLLLGTRPLPPGELGILGEEVPKFVLQPFNAQRLEEFAQAWFSENEAAERFLHEVRNAGISEVVQVPLLATIAAIAHESSPGRPLPNNRFGLYEQYIWYLSNARIEDADQKWGELRDRVSLTPQGRAAAELLYHRRIELAGYLARVRTAGRDALFAAAMRWSVAAAGTGIDPDSQIWQQYVLTLLNSTGLFTYVSGEVAFTHASFREHLAAAATASRLPAFDSEDPVWIQLIARALEYLGDVHRATLVHFARSNQAGHSLLNYLQDSDDDQLKLLAGQLMAEGAPSTSAHCARFLVSMQDELEIADSDSADKWMTVAGHLDDAAIRQFVCARSDDRGAPPEQRISAAYALRDTDPEFSSAALRSVLDDDEPHVREAAARALVGMAPEYTAEVVERLLTSDDSGLRYAGADLVLSVRQPYLEAVVDVLVTLMAHEDSTVRGNARDIFAEVAPEQIGYLLRSMLAEESIDGLPKDQKAVDHLLAGLDADDIDDTAAMLEDTFDDPRAAVRLVARRVFVTFGSKHRTRAVYALLTDSDDALCHAGGDLILKLDVEAASEVCRSLLCGESVEVRRTTLAALRQLDEEAPAWGVTDWAVELLMSGFFDSSTSAQMTTTIVLAELGGKFADMAAENWLALAEDPDPAIRRRGLLGLRGLLGPDTEHLTSLLRVIRDQFHEFDEETAPAVFSCLLSQHDAVIADFVCELREAADPGPFEFVLRELERYGGAGLDRVVATLRTWSVDPASDRGRLAAEALISLRGGLDAKADSALGEHLAQENSFETLLVDEIRFQLQQVDADDYEATTRLLREIFTGIAIELRYDIARRLSRCGPTYTAALKRAFRRRTS